MHIFDKYFERNTHRGMSNNSNPDKNNNLARMINNMWQIHNIHHI